MFFYENQNYPTERLFKLTYLYGTSRDHAVATAQPAVTGGMVVTGGSNRGSQGAFNKKMVRLIIIALLKHTLRQI